MSTDDATRTTTVLPLADPTVPGGADIDAAASVPDNAPAADASGDAPAPAAPLGAPRVRWAGIVWGLVLAGVASAAVWMTSSPAGVDGLVDTARGVTPGMLVAVAPLTLGGLVLVTGLVGLLRRAQRRSIRRNGQSA
ncbi:hypothetical protein [Microbacterium dextranolyticum]|uniref:Uncharacterized protein n=1 Tax=Microbacterium dextranolyticum TaxID=36806 RepID=A0A9W6M5X0_9MICO|nr:hypothetical protein [Microbacterium dextranolyticum]MBM7463886.1 hypothetical protein [Microbacterium dextranolyticum]GLJ94968.1 hypothetical protein GCM10017591_10300 [Microbacterium dextranolyticum]